MAINFLADLNLNGSALVSAALESRTSAPSTSSTGQIYYDSSASQVKIYNGTDYIVVGKEYSAGNGLNLSTTTFSVDAHDGITVDANGVSVDTTVIRTTGDQTKAGIMTFSNDVIVSGNLTVNGTTTSINTETINLADNIILLNSNYGGSTPSENGGIEVERGTLTNVSMVWNETSDRWTFTNDGTTYYNIPTTAEYNNYSLPTASSTVLGGVKIGSRISISSGVISADVQTDNNFTTTLKNKLDGIATNADNYGSWTVSDGTNSETVGSGTTVAWRGSGATSVSYDASTNQFNISSTDTNTTYSTATSSTLGLVKIGYTENGKNYPVELSNGQMFVNVPWVDTNTTYSVATTSANGLMSSTDKSKLNGIASGADNYSGWRISDGSTTETIGSADTLTVSASGAAGVSYDATSNTLTISSTDTNTQLSAETVKDYVADVMVGSATHVGISAVDNDAGNSVNLTNAYNFYTTSITHGGGDITITRATAGVQHPANVSIYDGNNQLVFCEINYDSTNNEWNFYSLPAATYDIVIGGKRV